MQNEGLARKELKTLKVPIPPPEPGRYERNWVGIFIGREGINKKRLEQAAPGATIHLKGKGCALRSQAALEKKADGKGKPAISKHLQNPPPKGGFNPSGPSKDGFEKDDELKNVLKRRTLYSEGEKSLGQSLAEQILKKQRIAAGEEPAEEEKPKEEQPPEEEETEPMHVLIEAYSDEALEAMRKEVMKIIQPEAKTTLTIYDEAQITAMAMESTTGGEECAFCGKPGHHHSKCPKRKSTFSMSGVRCSGCGNFGHTLRDCKGDRSSVARLHSSGSKPSKLDDDDFAMFEAVMESRSKGL